MDVGGFIMSVTLEKSLAGLGFSLDGGKGSIHGDKPIVINRIFKGEEYALTFFKLCTNY